MKSACLAAVALALFAMPGIAHADCRNNDRNVQVTSCTKDIRNASTKGDRAEAYLYRCQAYDMLGEYADALADCQEALTLNPKDNSIHNSMSIIYQNLKRYDQAIAASDRAIKGNDTVAGYFNTRANTHCSAGNINKSMNDRMLAMNKGLYSATRIQEILQSKGFYNGAIDGKFGGGSRKALENWTRAGCR